MPNRHVFLSYSRVNLDEARQLREELEREGFSVWWDQMILPGQDWKFEIRKAMKRCGAIVLCLSKEAVARRKSGIYPEALDAISIYREYKPGEIYIIPVRFSESNIPPIEIDGTRTLDRLQYVDLFPVEKRNIGVKLLMASLRVALQSFHGAEDDPEIIAETHEAKIEITIDRDIGDYSKEDQDRFIRAIGEFLELGSIRIIKRKPGSVKLTLELSQAQADRLFWAIKYGVFKEHDIADVRFEEPEKEVFISYAWGGESEEIVNQLDLAFKEREISIVRDKRDLGFKGRIKAFMEDIGRGKCVIVVISNKYLESSNCMFELVQIAQNGEFYGRTFPVVLEDAKIYDPLDRLDYVEYWEKKKETLKEKMSRVGAEHLKGIREDLDLYDNIRDAIAGLTNTLRDMNTLTAEMHREAGFAELIDAVVEKLAE